MLAQPRSNVANFGPFQLDLKAGELHRDGRSVRLQEQPFQVLKMLLEHPGDVVTRDEMRRTLWPNDTIVEFDQSINAAIKKLRLALQDSAEEPRYVETVARRGYRLMVPVEWEPTQQLNAEAAKVESAAPRQNAAAGSLIGKKLSHYRVLQVLGGGGMGVVYKAEDLKLGRPVALKFLPEELASDARSLSRFEREARTASALDHPNICTIYEFGEHEGQSFIAMQFLEGQTLRERMAASSDLSRTAEDGATKPRLRTAGFTTEELLELAVQIANGLAAAHEKGIVHRDIKPANIFITNRDEAKILDFGLAKLTYADQSEGLAHEETQTATGHDLSLSLTGVAMGTVPYMSPEQVRGEKLDARTDLFSFGLVLYEMATGQQAFRGDTAAALHEAILHETPTPARSLNPELPPRLEEIINKALEKDPDARYETAAEMCADLKQLHRDNSSLISHKWGLAAGLVLIGLLLGAVLYSTRGLRSSNVSHAKITHKQFTFSGNAYEPAISPDGFFVAYISRKPGEQQKLMLQASNGAALELARSTDIEYPRWSPDGSEVLFFRNEPALYDAEPTAKNRGISVVSRLGGVVRPIGTGQCACWTAPDGSEVVVAHSQTEVRLVNKLTGVAKEVHLSKYTLLRDIDCSVRAGLILAVTKTADKFQIRTFKPDGGEERTLIEQSDEIYSARWSPTGDSIYYLHGKGSTTELSKVSLTHGSEPAVLADGLETGGFFTLSADGSRLAYTRENGNSNLWRVDLPTARKNAKPEISRLTTGTSHYGAPSFSPDGRWIAFALGANSDETNIFKMPVAGGEPVQLTLLEHATSHSPAWSPDGQRIAFIGDQNGVPRVWTISANGGTAQPVGNPNGSDTGNNKLAWWPSSDIIYQQTGVRNFLRINEKTHEEKALIHDQSVGWVPFRPIFSPDGKKMAVYWNRKEEGLWIISLEPYSETRLESGGISPFGWSPDGKYVYAVRMEAEREIIRVQVATPNEVTSVATLPGDVVDDDGASVSPDGKAIFATVSEEKSDVWLMENFDPSPR